MLCILYSSASLFFSWPMYRIKRWRGFNCIFSFFNTTVCYTFTKMRNVQWTRDRSKSSRRKNVWAHSFIAFFDKKSAVIKELPSHLAKDDTWIYVKAKWSSYLYIKMKYHMMCWLDSALVLIVMLFCEGLFYYSIKLPKRAMLLHSRVTVWCLNRDIWRNYRDISIWQPKKTLKV